MALLAVYHDVARIPCDLMDGLLPVYYTTSFLIESSYF